MTAQVGQDTTSTQWDLMTDASDMSQVGTGRTEDMALHEKLIPFTHGTFTNKHSVRKCTKTYCVTGYIPSKQTPVNLTCVHLVKPSWTHVEGASLSTH
jgi:hypothetical protein